MNQIASVLRWIIRFNQRIISNVQALEKRESTNPFVRIPNTIPEPNDIWIIRFSSQGRFLCVQEEWNFYWRAGGWCRFLLDCLIVLAWGLTRKTWNHTRPDTSEEMAEENMTSILKVLADERTESKRLVYHTKRKSKLQKLPWPICVNRNVNKIPKVAQDRFNLKLIKGNWAAAWKQRWRNKKLSTKTSACSLLIYY